MLIVGLTGGIATGKSVVTRRMEENGAFIIDADAIAHEVVKKGAPAWKEIVDTFGREYLLPDGEINRKAIGRIVFHDAMKKEELNRIVHPRVFEKISESLLDIIHNEKADDGVVILDVPLLYESGMDKDISDIIVVYAPVQQQLERLMARDDLTEIDAKARINSQISIEEKKKWADILIDNSGDIKATIKQADRVFAMLKEKAAKTT
ncbi:MAG: dephospho-CoA kinase [Desulfococcus sp. 4484_241]|nr:MAG: dephospho-CoA kinase [Desulfococcus sp. 4484_241]RLC32173.1 MAG: dephospho-CoA kinase [Deltaproteobacteria bacterium]